MRPLPDGFRAMVLIALTIVGGLVLAPLARAGRGGDGPRPLETTDADYFQPGTQPAMSGFVETLSAEQCRICHANYDPVHEPYTTWAASMLGQSARDPVFWAALDVVNQDIADGGQYCLRCHAPAAFLGDRIHPPDGSGFAAEDFEGVSCSICHRMLDTVYVEGVSPPEDFDILQALADNREYNDEGLVPKQQSNAQYVIDPDDVRRGPYDDLPFNPHIGVPPPPVIPSPHHWTSELCWTCHDVSNPLTVRREDGTYALDALDAAHRSAEQTDMFPLHRTYSEWLNSWYFTQGGVQHNGRFGGNHPTGIMNICQDCHMPDQQAFGCGLGPPFVERPDMAQHSFVGSNTWVLNAVRDLFPDTETGLDADSVAAAIARNVTMLENASDLTVTQVQSVVRARVVNQSGHKLPTGFPDGRRIWVNAKFYDADQNLMEEVGDYDFETATLDAENTTVYECRLGLDEAQAELTGLPVGDTLHFMLANVVEKDNRIPPQGFSNVVALQNQTEPVGASFANGQHWHDTDIFIPERAAEAVVTVYYQLTSREFIEFLRDNGGERGAIAYDQWAEHGKSQPVVMDMVSIDLGNPADVNQDGVVDFQDLLLLLSFWGVCPEPPAACPVDINNDGFVDFRDVLLLLAFWTPVEPTGACCFDDGSCQVLTPSACADQDGAYAGNDVACEDANCVRPTGACCFDDGSCQVLEETDCSDQGGLYAGDGVTCGDAGCPQPTGACCFDNGACDELEPAECARQGGVYAGDGVPCEDASCPQPTGACCFDDGSCQVLEAPDCAAQGGVYAGDDVTCEAADCPQPTGACCFADGSCQVIEEADCIALGGLYSGDEVTCPQADCPQPTGACCFEDGSCQVVEEGDCSGQGGVYAGDDVSCPQADCPQPTGACCFDDGSCQVIEEGDCSGQGGVYAGDDVSCPQADCPQPTGACCFADGSCQVIEAGDCAAQGGAYAGDDVTCPAADCPQPSGACCFDDGSCQVIEEADCTAQGGVYSGNDVTCPDADCPQPTGACCLDDGSCQVIEAGACDGLGGAYQGDGIDCGDVLCVTPQVAERRIGASENDAEENSANGEMDLFSTDLELAVSNDPTDTVGMRFESLGIVPGATIRSAWIQFQVDEVSTGASSLTIRAQADDDASPFSADAFDLTSRALTPQSISWSPPGWSVIGEAGPNQRTPDLTELVQAVVDRPGWTTGSALVIVVTGSGRRTAEAFDGLSSAAPLLHVDYVVAGACCLDATTCVTTDPASCGAAGGSYRGPGVACEDIACDRGRGACCFENDGSCAELSEFDCDALGGTYQGDEVLCPDVQCYEFGVDCCLNGRPRIMTMRYTADDCSATNNDQDGRVQCTDFEPLAPTVYIIANDKDNPNDGEIWFAGPVRIGEAFVLDAANAGQDRLKDDTRIHVFDFAGGTELQRVKFRSKCDEVLETGFQFGSVVVLDCVGENE